MCGIVGYNGFRNANEILIESLKKLEYRGYDSAGISTVTKKINLFKNVGEISDLEKKIPKFKGDIGIGHTRWATMGAVTQKNAHPHIGCNKKIAIVHNGIIENFEKLKRQLEKKGHKFTSNTDSEIIAHLVEENYTNNLEEAVRAAVKKIQGSYAIVVACKDESDKLVGVRNESPLVIGIGDNENFVASDVPAFLKYTNRVIYLDDGELCVLGKKKVSVFNKHNKEIKKEEHVVNWDIKDAEKSGFPHFMLKEIYDQPDALNRVLRGRVSEIEHRITFAEKVEKILESENNLDSIDIVACGTSFYAGMVGRYLIEQLTDIPVHVQFASEYRYFGSKRNRSLVIAVTQSGETADTLAALREAKNAECKTLVITNVMGSTATRIADGYILTQSGPEIGVAATKTFSSQIMILLLVGLKLGVKLNQIGSDQLINYIRELKEISSQVREIIDNNHQIKEIAEIIKKNNTVFYIGRGIDYPLALEGALKLKEISYIHAEGFPAGELKHGPFALLTEKTPVIALISRDFTYNKIIANIGEIKARNSPVIAVTDNEDHDTEKHADYVIRYNSNHSLTACFSKAAIMQFLAYHTADLRGCNIDKPRNLAKSVTVE